jgi:hypothetical protein
VSDALRLMVFDATCRGRGALPGLSHAWSAGSGLYRAGGNLDHAFGATSWAAALDWIANVGAGEAIAQIQFWGHGKWGSVRMGDEALTIDSLAAGAPHERRLRSIRERLSGPGALWWFRSCETFGAEPGHTFARRWTDYFGCRAAGHSYIIGFWQSGLHSLGPGQTPGWPRDEGLALGTPAAPERALWSRPWLDHTISCLRSTIPTGW